jgi:hypothetical protein
MTAARSRASSAALSCAEVSPRPRWVKSVKTPHRKMVLIITTLKPVRPSSTEDFLPRGARVRPTNPGFPAGNVAVAVGLCAILAAQLGLGAKPVAVSHVNNSRVRNVEASAIYALQLQSASRHFRQEVRR